MPGQDTETTRKPLSISGPELVLGHRDTGGVTYLQPPLAPLSLTIYISERNRVKTMGDVPAEFETPSMPTNPPNTWLTYHLAHPGPGGAIPGDPNPAFYYRDRYHLHYIYNHREGFAFAHVSSKDMVHWKWHPTTLTPGTTGHGMFSGTGFFTKDGQAAMIYHGQGSGRNQLAFALDDNLERWSKPISVEPLTATGEEPDMNHWDPDCWLMDGAYYGLSGGSNPALMKSEGLKQWLYLGELFPEDFPTNLGVDRGEDVSCPNMFKIGNKWMLLCISHGLGARYYLGDFVGEKYALSSRPPRPVELGQMGFLCTGITVDQRWSSCHVGLVHAMGERDAKKRPEDELRQPYG
jgi:sucrose-6-phosphate hydrolase SacC (GH32 family)